MRDRGDPGTGAGPVEHAGPARHPGTAGVCVTRSSYDPAGLVLARTLPTAGGAAPGSTARQTSTTYTDDRLSSTQTAPSPAGTGTAVTRTRYDAVGQPLAVADPLGHVSTTSWTDDHLTASTSTPGYTRPDGTTVSHITRTGYNADGQPTSRIEPSRV